MPSRGLLWAVKSTLPALLYSHGGTPDTPDTGQLSFTRELHVTIACSRPPLALTFSAELFVTKL